MKKSFLMLGAAIVALSSCTQSEVLNVAQQPERPIGFEPFVDKQTRATNDITDGSEGFKELYVFGVKGTKPDGGVFTPDTDNDGSNGKPYYFNEVKVTGGKTKWTYSPHMPWLANKVFRFAAYANGMGDGTSTVAKLDNVTFVPEEAKTEIVTETDASGTQTSKEITTHVWGLDITGYTASDKDLIAAVPEEKVVGDISTAPASVGLTFKHLLAKVIVQFRYTPNDNNADLKLEVEPFSFKAYKTGDCEVRYTGVENNTVIGANWTTSDQTTTAYDLFERISGANQTWEKDNIQSEVYVIPQSNSDITIENIKINSKNSNNEETSTTVFNNVSLKIEGHTDWKPGYVYRYIADITPGEHYIHFTTSVTSWIDEDNRNQTITGGTTVSD